MIQFLVCILVSVLGRVHGETVSPGTWQLLIENGGVSAMHMATTYMGTVVMYDRTEAGASNISLPNGICIDQPHDETNLIHDCSAHSIEYNIATNKVRALMIMTDTWCSSGAFSANGTLVSTGGFNNGSKGGSNGVRYFVPCSSSTCDWDDPGSHELLEKRWYASNQILPDNRIIVVGGTSNFGATRAFSYEFLPKKPGEQLYALPFLAETTDDALTIGQENNLYPFLHLASDGNLFIFANRDSILFDYQRNRVVRTFPRIPDGPRNYPATGSSVMLPLLASDGFRRIEIMICGGASDNCCNLVKRGIFNDALQSCGRIVITDPTPVWAMENMPAPRSMGDMFVLPNGEILIINGAEKGCAGWWIGRNPALAPYLYRPNALEGQRFSILASSTIPRMYHSSANVLPDGRILVGGSNPNPYYVFNVSFPTELRLEAYSPYYLDKSCSSLRPTIISVSPSVSYGNSFKIQFSVSNYTSSNIQFNIYAPTFTTHSFSMNQRLLLLNASSPELGGGIYSALVTAPPTSVAAPPGYYMLFVVNSGIPSVAKWIHLS